MKIEAKECCTTPYLSSSYDAAANIDNATKIEKKKKSKQKDHVVLALA